MMPMVAAPGTANPNLPAKNEEPSTTNDTPLSPQEQQRLAECESILRREKVSFWSLGNALNQIKTARLYRERFPSFEAYCRQWHYRRAHAYRLVAAAEFLARLSPIGDILPRHESQVRPLAGLTTDQALAAWRKAVAAAKGKPVTAKLVKAAAAEFRPQPPSASPRRSQPFPKPEALSPLFDQLHDLFNQIEYSLEQQHDYSIILSRLHLLRRHFRQLALLIL